jgi:hypothetical protein
MRDTRPVHTRQENHGYLAESATTSQKPIRIFGPLCRMDTCLPLRSFKALLSLGETERRRPGTPSTLQTSRPMDRYPPPERS